jgi:peptidoglycan/xylan/chitin deacetylase (PgdA/CDA1 family)/SH3-like domain-containing protein
MNRYRTRRVSPARTHTRTRTRARSRSSFTFSPVVAFLLIASFGILFAGCGKVDVRGPDAAELDDSFTASDVEKLNDLDGETTSTGSLMGGATSEEGGVASVPRLDISAGTASGSDVLAVDPELKKKYDAIRTPSTAEAANVYRVNNEFVNVRSAPTSNASTVARLNQGERMVLIEFVNGAWAKVKLTSGAEGFVSTRYIARMTTDTQLAQDKKATEGMYFVDYAFVNIRNTADAKSDKLGEIPGQTMIKPLGVNGEWAHVSYNGMDGYVSTQFLKPFEPQFIVRQETFQLPILRYDLSEPGAIEALVDHAGKLRAAGASLTTLRAFQELVLTQEVRDVRLPPKSVVIAVTGITAENVRRLSDSLYGANIPATFFLESRTVGLSGISQKIIATLQANGFDLEVAGHTGDDLRGLTNSQVQLEVRQSKKLLEDLMNQSVIAILYPQGGVNERVSTAVADGGYLFGIGAVPDSSFMRDEFLRLPSYAVTGSMTAEDVVKLVK